MDAAAGRWGHTRFAARYSVVSVLPGHSWLEFQNCIQNVEVVVSLVFDLMQVGFWQLLQHFQRQLPIEFNQTHRRVNGIRETQHTAEHIGPWQALRVELLHPFEGFYGLV
jgi:hypothetical protein